MEIVVSILPAGDEICELIESNCRYQLGVMYTMTPSRSTVAASGASARRRGLPAGQLRVSAYDRTASLLIALLVLIGLFVVGITIVYVTIRLADRTVAVPITLAQPAARPADAAMGLKRDLEPPGIEDMPELEEPSLPQTLAALTSITANETALLHDEAVASDAEAGRGQGLGDNRRAGIAGEGVNERVPRWERWRIRYLDVEGIETYARQLDFFGIELAVLGADNRIHYASHLTEKPAKKFTRKPEDESRLYFTWRDGALRRSDEQLLERSGIAAANRPILQFCPARLEATFLQLEKQHAKNRSVDDIRKTIFAVEAAGDQFTMVVVEQIYFR